jgi:hypothetical protein
LKDFGKDDLGANFVSVVTGFFGSHRTDKGRSILQTKDLDDPVCGHEQKWMQRAANCSRLSPFPGFPAISKDKPMGYLERLIELVWLEESLAKQRIDDPKQIKLQ